MLETRLLFDSREIRENTFSYPAYLALMDRVVSEKRTTGPKQSPEYAEYTHLNWVRMQRLAKIVTLGSPLQSALATITAPQYWYILTEAWCGDAAQNIPVLAKMAEANPLIELRFLLRDENPGIMDHYLTDGGRSIPKLIALDAGYGELFTWGPRPAGAQALLLAFKAEPTRSFAEFAEEIQRWYLADKTQGIQEEFTELLRKSAKTQEISNG